MFYHLVMFTVLCASVCLTAGAYFLLRHPKLVERYAAWFGSLGSNHHAMFAAVFGALALMEAYDRFWFGTIVFGVVTCVYGYFAVHTTKKVTLDEPESA